MRLSKDELFERMSLISDKSWSTILISYGQTLNYQVSSKKG